jgi:acetyltransferase EpsM
MKRTPERLVIIGAGGHASVVIDAALSAGRARAVRGYVAPERSPVLEQRLGIRWLGDDERYLATGPASRRGDRLVIGVGGVGGDPVRARIAARYEAAGCRFGRAVHAGAIVAKSAVVGDGAAVMAGAVVNPGAQLGEHCIVNTGAIVEHDVVLSRLAAVSPGAVIGGGAHVGENTFVGLGARVRDHVRIGRDVVVGMGAVVVGDVPDGAVVLGVPARRREVTRG